MSTPYAFTAVPSLEDDDEIGAGTGGERHRRLRPQLPLPTGLYWTLWSVFTLKWFRSLLRTIWVLVNNLYAISSYFLWLLVLSPVRIFHSASLYYRLEEVFFGWLLTLVACWNYTAGYSIAESGDRLDDIIDEPFLYMPNHQSTADVPYCMNIFAARSHGPDKVMWIMDKVFKYTNFGWVAWMHDDFFILAGKENRELSLVNLKKHLRNVFIPKRRKYLVLFPEGGFLRKRKKISQDFAKKNDLPLLEYCTLPRTGALEIILEVLGKTNYNNNNGVIAIQQQQEQQQSSSPKIRKLVDVTIAYPEGKPLDLLTILLASRPPCVTHVHYRIFDVENVPSDSEGIKHWMYNIYIEKEKMLKEYYATGVWPYDMLDKNAHPPKEIVHDPLWFICLHLFHLASFLIGVWILSYLYSLIF